MSFRKRDKVHDSRFDFVVITISTVISSTLTFIYSVYARRHVSPYDYGVFTSCALLLTYLGFIQLGTLNAYNRDYSQLIGTVDKSKIEKLRNTTFTFLLVIYSIVTFIIIGALLIAYNGEILDYYAIGLVSNSLVGFATILGTFAIFTARMNDKYIYSGIIEVIKTTIAVGFGYFFVKHFGYYGMYAMPIVLAVLTIALYYKISMVGIKLSIDLKILQISIKTGMPLLINNLVWTLLMSVDKFLILIFMTTEDMGLYSVALLGFSTMLLVPQSMSQVFYYKISKLYGETGNVGLLVESVTRHTKIVSLFTSASSVVGFYMLPIFVNFFMPGYRNGIFAAQILVIGVSLYSTTMLFGNVFSILKMNKELIHSTALLCIFNIVLSTGLCYFFGMTIVNIAMGTSISYVLYSVYIVKHITKRFGGSFVNALAGSWLPVFINLVPCVIVSVVFKSLIFGLLISVLISSALLAITNVKSIRVFIKKKVAN